MIIFFKLVGLLALILSLFILINFIMIRYSQPKKRWRAIRNLFFPFLIMSGFVGWHLDTQNLSLSLGNFGPLLSFLIVCLIHLGYLGVYGYFDRSISLRTIIEINDANRPITYAELEARYQADKAFERRLQILLENNFLLFESGQYKLTVKGRWLGSLVFYLKTFYRTGPGG